jgi:hypothetical protein
MANYVTLQEVREQAGLQQKERGESLGTGDGSNTIFYTGNTPVVDANYSDSVTVADLVVYVAGTSVTISAIVASNGKITLAVAPANGAAVTGDYDWSEIEDAVVQKYLDEAHNLIISALSKSYTISDLDTNTPKLLLLIEKKLAAGLMLDKEYSVGGDETEDMRGARWIKWAEKQIQDIVDGKTPLIDTNGSTVSTIVGGDVEGWPDNTTEDEDEADSGGAIKFRIKKKF